MPSARTRSRGAFLNWRFAVNGIQNAECSRSVMKSARLFMAESRIAERTYEAYSFANLRGRNHSAHPAARRSRSRLSIDRDARANGAARHYFRCVYEAE